MSKTQNQRRTQIGCLAFVIIFFGAALVAKWTSFTSSSSSSQSQESHTCGYCNTNFYGNGWSTAGGEQFQQTSWSGYGYCSKKCAYESQPTRWK